MPTEACSEELETLAAIFLEDLSIKEVSSEESTVLSIVLYPATGDDEESRYVTLTLEIELCSEYPERLPKIVFRNPRGLSEILLAEMEQKMSQKCEELQGSQMVFELIDMAKEFLTSNNRPASECPICLLSFTEYDVFHRSDCFHHFHSYCLGRYLQSLEQKESSQEDTLPNETTEKTCPVCRKDLPKSIDVKFLLEAPPPSEETEWTEADTEAVLSEWNRKWASRNELFMKQKLQGGIINLADKCKNLLVISSPTRNQGQRENETETVTAGSTSETSNSTFSQSVRVSSFPSQSANRAKNSVPSAGSASDLSKNQPSQQRAKASRETTSHVGVGPNSHGDSGRYRGGQRRRNK